MLTKQAVHVAMLLWGVIFSFIAAICMYMSKNFDREKRIWMICMQIFSACLLANDAIAWAYRGGTGVTAYYGVRMSNFFVFLLSDVVLILFHGYVCCCLFGSAKLRNGTGPRRRMIAVYAIAVLGVIMVIVSQFTHLYYYIDSHNVYHRAPAHILCMLIPFAGMIVDLSLIIQYRKRIGKDIFVSLMSYLALPILATVVQSFYYGVSLTNIAICISMITMFVVSMVEQNRQLAMSENSAADLKIELMLSQIAPHFIYNTLTTISQMCDTDPKLAKETTIEFSNYLRGNMNSLSSKECIPFDRELQHTKYYTAIEKKRFGDRINVVYDIDDKDFLIPPLTLQPLVENAIKHGLCMKKGGGTVKIKTERNDVYTYVIVIDDGAGFDKTELDAMLERQNEKSDMDACSRIYGQADAGCDRKKYGMAGADAGCDRKKYGVAGADAGCDSHKNGMAGAGRDDSESHIGLRNVASRLQSMCDGSLQIDSAPGRGTVAVISIPLHIHR